MLKLYIKAKDITLNVSQGNDQFALWQNDTLTKYNKKDITQINIYGRTGRSSAIFNLYEIAFADNSNLFIPGILIDRFEFLAKFPSCTPDYKGGYFLTSKTFRNYIR